MTSFPIVGIGASAGGLNALTELTKVLDPGSRLAYVVVQHLGPDSPSILPGLLATQTTIKVEEATDGVVVEPQTMYVIPANTMMTLDDGHLLLTPRVKSITSPTPIDRFFESLADEQGRNAIGVILSGTGNDGAAGLRAIKNAGGLTFAQSEASAKFFEMPRASIDLDVVDHILSPPEIAGALLKLINHPYFAHQGQTEPDILVGSESEEGVIRKILVELKVRTAVDFSLYKRGTIRRRIARRLAVNGLSELEEYLLLLKGSRDECDILSRELLIQVTDFFRDPDLFEGLTHMVFPQLFSHWEESRPIRIWVPGCASGEEVYSIAISILEYLGPRGTSGEVQFFGTDLSDSAIEKARSGIYPDTISRHVSEERLQRFFVKKNGGYRIASSIRNMCVFARQNVVDDPPFSRIDLISCRNLLIYLDNPLQKKVMGLFNYALKSGGFLILGPSESIGATSELFSPVDKRLRIFTKKLQPGKISTSLFDPLERLVHAPAPRKYLYSFEQPESDRLIREADRAAIKRYVPPGVLCDNEFNILEYRGDTTPFIGNPVGPPSISLQKLVRPEFLVELSNGMREARESNQTVLVESLKHSDASVELSFSVEIIPLNLAAEQVTWFWVFFIREAANKLGSASPKKALLGPIIRRLEKHLFPAQLELDERNQDITRLTRDLESTRAYVRNLLETHEATIEELNAAEEELLSSNEEYQSTNEELQTAQEELQSSNDELRARNRELNVLNEELTQSRDFSEAIVETICQPLLVLSNGLVIHRANPAFYREFQLRPEQVEGRHFFDIGFDYKEDPSFRDTLSSMILEHGSIENLEVEVSHKKLGIRVLRINVQCLNWDHEAGALMLLEDITERRAAIKKLQKMDHRKDEFMAILGHELRNPLMPIRNVLEIWRQGHATENEIRQMQETMDRQLTHEARLIDELIDLSRVNRGSIVLKSSIVDIAQISKNVAHDLSHFIEEHQHQLITNISPDPVFVEGDAVRLSQIVSNLLCNAIKYTPDGGKISISLIREGGQAMLNVADSGIGIEPSQIEEIFELFFQADSSIARTKGGLGIGLTLTQRLVELHHGEICVYSEGLGKGASFTVRIPVAKDNLCAETKVVNTAPDVSPGSLHRSRRILVVDDNVDAAESLSLLLSLGGHTTEVAFDGLEAIDRANSFHPEVVILDIGLPGLSGYEVARKLREMDSLENPLIIALSGYGQPEDIEKAMASGFDHHLVKPANTDRLLELIDQGSSQKELQHTNKTL